MILTSCILCAPHSFAAQPIKAQVSKVMLISAE